MVRRRLSPIWMMALLAACSLQEPASGLKSDTLHTELPPAELPTYAKGDSYSFDNPRETWTVVAIDDGLVTWQSSLGGTQTTMFDPLLPPIKWQKPNETEGYRRIVEWSGSLFPLKAGNKLTYKSTVQVDETRGHALFVWNCYAGHPRRVSVPAGEFAAFPVFCRRSDGRTLHSFYAPALNSTISTTHGSPSGEQTIRNLLAFKVGPGARVTARQPESLPGGWSTATVAKWDSQGISVPRVQPERVATANPPLAFATPGPTSRSAAQQPDARDANGTRAYRDVALAPPKILAPGKQEERMRASDRISRKSGERRGKRDLYGAHLGSFSTSANARRAWQILGDKHKSLLDHTDHAVYPVDLGKPKGILYRLVAGPMPSPTAMRKLCRDIKGEGGYCRVIPIQ